MDIHTTDAPKPPWFDGKFYKSCVALMPFIRWGIVASMFLFGAYIYQRDTNAQNNISVLDLKQRQDLLERTMNDRRVERDKQIDDMKKTILTREVFEAYHSADQQRMERMEQMMAQILQRP